MKSILITIYLYKKGRLLFRWPCIFGLNRYWFTQPLNQLRIAYRVPQKLPRHPRA